MLKDKYKGYFDIGCSVNEESLSKNYDFIHRHYNSITLENEMKIERILPEEGIYQFSFPDKVVEYVNKYSMRLRGHTLVWHNQNPDWLFKNGNKLVTKEVLQDRMKEYFKAIMNHFASSVYAWDVVNEAVEDKSGKLLRASPWLEVLGENFIYDAFVLAHEIQPDAQLYYNDYNETDPMKREKIYQLVKSLKKKGAPIHGIGMQGHWNLYGPSIDEIRRTIELYASLDVRLQVTELDMSVYAYTDRRTDLKQLDKRLSTLQADRYEKIFELFREYQDVIDAVTFWAVTDDYTWLDNFPVFGRKNWPTVFDEKAQPKESYHRIMNF
ncbi:1,4-beta-xylanase [Globicatella sp. HMSC072A10]|uniref:endo-1,4-beta-xylanase n=1 Tax=Globicatella sp. HMSC072A10 TaxID=1739315 RepID=UPI0008D29415|nr:endo-1,4-beta-xylanase [Globicatella sp. HMSC072A10]OFK56512.1 1,4-beta-xylanase [Globicatella sp. HMSC072A10]